MGNISYPAANDSPTGGAKVYRNLILGDTGAVVKAGPGRLYGWHISNAGDAAAYVKLYNKATAGTKSDTSFMTIGVPLASAVSFSVPPGITFSVGISARATTAAADGNEDVAAPSANDVVINLFYA